MKLPPTVNASIYFVDRIPTVAFDTDNVYVVESDDSDYTLTLGYPDGNQTIVLDSFVGVEYQPLAAPARLKPRRKLTTTWAYVKQK